MAKAHIVTTDGTKITIEGSRGEVSSLVARLGTVADPARAPRPKIPKAARTKATPVNLLSSLIDGGFFRKPKDLAAVKVALEEMGHFYPVTTLSPALLRLVRKRHLRRLKEKNRWLYTG